MSRPTPQDLLQEMLASAGLATSDVAARVVLARSADYWRELAPGLTIGEPVAATSTLLVPSAESLAPLRGRFSREGYLHLPPEFPVPQLRQMVEAVEALRRYDWPPVFAFVYDPFWQLVRLPGVTGVLQSLLGPNCRQSVHFWLHYVPPHRGASGWGPHQDNTGHPGRLTLWIPLTDAVPENGCIYILPRDEVPESVLDAWHRASEWQSATVLQALHHVRALPAAAGTALLWDQDLIHWGAAHRGGEVPRIAFSTEFIDEAETPTADERPVFELGAELPDFETRLRLIAGRILDYRRWELRMTRFVPLAEALAAPRG